MRNWIKWGKAAAIRAAKTFAQTTVALLPASAMITDVDWKVVVGTAALAAVASYYLFAHVRSRVAAWKDPFAVYDSAGYQIVQGLFAIGAGGWDVCYEEVTLRPDFDLRSLLTPGGNLNIGGFSGSEDLNNYFAAAMENRGNHYDLYRFIMDRGYICPVMFLNNAVFTARGVFTGLHPTPGNIFYGIENIRVNEQDAEEE